jgi:hypothetical protein
LYFGACRSGTDGSGPSSLVNYYQKMRIRNNEASKRARLKRRIKQVLISSVAEPVIFMLIRVKNQGSSSSFVIYNRLKSFKCLYLKG